ncbi:PepSY-like domain-containing protein [Salegentibacter flavus]|uniref:Putative beta-lactamase-inhibitor-like, PepSY-like n=1 Tax=Salegentibacter flavus TaxID=287099 RepID=A0A1I5BBF8_9FLAO|nr:PepSY-like domain-containing protein [Salegentibacter flavus]SFN72042.1 Putative beta-lactamase-inhibitor-like, PepSY-like [Salegentibacter flavus]
MKRIKILGITLLTAFIGFSCSSDDDGDTGTAEVDLSATAIKADAHVQTSSLPQPILDYVSANYPGLTIRKAEIEDDDTYEITLSDETELIFDMQGNFLGIDDDDVDDFGDEDLDPSELPQNIQDFIAQYFPGVGIDEAERENNGNYEVELNNDVELIFNADGEFLGKGEDEDDAYDDDDEDIDPADLPQVILDYIAENYPEQTIIEAEKEDDGYEVTLNNGVELEFDVDGAFISAEDKNGDDDDDDENEDD